MIYGLYCNKKELTLRIEPTEYKAILIESEDEWVSTPIMYISSLYICNNKKLLKEKAIDIKNDWILEAKKLVNKAENIKIEEAIT